jgi:hypothetical protein
MVTTSLRLVDIDLRDIIISYKIKNIWFYFNLKINYKNKSIFLQLK